MLFTASCNKEAQSPEGKSLDGKANVSLSIVSAPTTKAGETENKLNSVEVFIFDNGATSTYAKYSLQRTCKNRRRK